MQVVAERLRREYKLNLYTGGMQVAYREGVSTGYTHESEHSPNPTAAADIRIAIAIAPTAEACWATGGGGGGGKGDSEGGAGEGGGLVCSATRGVREQLSRRELIAAYEGLQGASQYGPLQESLTIDADLLIDGLNG